MNALTIDGVELTAENVKNDTYSIARPFLFVNKEGNISEAGTKFIDYILSDEGQKIVEEEGLASIINSKRRICKNVVKWTLSSTLEKGFLRCIKS